MYELILDKERCKSCGFCITACPKNAIYKSGHRNKQSYETVEVNRELCILCGSCYTVCPDNVFQIINTTVNGGNGE